METGFQNTKTAKCNLPLAVPLYPPRGAVTPLFLQCELMFGSPSSNCSGNGICKIVARSGNPYQTFERMNCNHTKALLSVTDGRAGVTLTFRRDWLCFNLMKRHFRHGILEMPEPCPIPPEMATALRLNIRELPAGLHLIEDHKTHFQIKFKLVIG